MEEGMTWFGGQFSFAGHERWQLWFDNPNKAAVLLVELALLGLVMAFAKGRRRTFVGFLLFMLPSLALVQTFSRGGLVAWIASVFFVMWRRVREYGWNRRIVAIVGAVLLVFASCVHQGLSRRMASGLSGDDRSVGNRFAVWSEVPQMMCDAPLGWGLGNSGSAYMNWYQPLDRYERYRTLVSSHLTWFVETGWAGVCFWMAAWLSVLYFGIVVGLRFRRWSCFSEWICLCVAGAFSSVMESAWLWIAPVATALCEAVFFRRGLWLCLHRCAILGSCCGLVFTVMSFTMVKTFCAASPVRKSLSWVEYLGNGCLCWVVVDPDVLGGENYPRVLRAAADMLPVTFRLVDDASELPVDADFVVFCGKKDSGGKRGRKVTIWLSPTAGATVASDDIVMVGEFSAASDCWGSAKMIEVAGVADYIPSWPREVCSVLELHCHE